MGLHSGGRITGVGTYIRDVNWVTYLRDVYWGAYIRGEGVRGVLTGFYDTQERNNKI